MMEIFNGDASDIRERLIWVIKQHAGTPARYKLLEDQFGIPARRWQNVCNRVQQPSLEMLTALTKSYPYFSDWMVTGTNKTVIQVNPADQEWQQKASSWIEPKQLDQSQDFRHRVITASTVLYGQEPTKMSQKSGIESAVWKKLLDHEIEPTVEIIKAICKDGPKYALWVMNGTAETYLQISPLDKWQQKLGRALGADFEDGKDQWQKGFVKALGGETNKQL